MKVKYFLVWMVIFPLLQLSGCTASKQLTSEEKFDKEKKLLEAIENRTIIVEVDRALPFNGSSRIESICYKK